MRHFEGEEPVPGFRLLKFLGRGGIGEVWKASAPGKTFCALKFISLSGKQGRKEYRAIKLVKNIHHAHLVPISGIWLRDHEGQLLEDEDEVRQRSLRDSIAYREAEFNAPAEMVIHMGLGEESLHDRMLTCQRQGKQGIPPEELLDYLEEAAKGIDFLNTPRHDLGSGPQAVTHGDIKPQNIMLVGGSVQVADFGLARSLGGDARATTVSASPAYGAPESLAGGVNAPSSDQYSLAISYFELRTGQLPFDDESYFGVLSAHTKGKLNLTALPAAEREVITRATRLDPAQRYESCLRMVRQLRRAYEGTLAESTTDGIPRPSLEELGLGSPTASGTFSPVKLETPAPLEAGAALVPHLTLVRRVLQSGIDETWSASSSSGAQVTLFVRDLVASEEAVDLRALRLLSKLEHPHLARLTSFWLLDAQHSPVDAGDAATPPASARRLVLGERQFERTLLDRLAECRAEGLDGIPRDELLGYMLGVAQALDYLNAQQHVWAGSKVSLQHGQVRPHDLELHEDAQGRRVRLGNYLQSRLLEADSIILTKGGIRASHAYLAPELKQGHLSRWSDQYSLGVTYCHLRTGIAPTGLADMVESSLDLSALPGPEASVLERATSPDLEQRFETCKEFITELSMAVARARRPTRRSSVQITGTAEAIKMEDEKRAEPKPDVAKVEEKPAKVEHAKTEPKPETAKPETVKPEPKPAVKPEAAKVEPAKTEPTKAEPAKPEPAKAKDEAKSDGKRDSKAAVAAKPAVAPVEPASLPAAKSAPVKAEPAPKPGPAAKPSDKASPASDKPAAKPAAASASPSTATAARPAGAPLIPSMPSIKSTVDFDEAFQMLLRESGSFPPPMPLNAPPATTTAAPAAAPALKPAAAVSPGAFQGWMSQMSPRSARILMLAVLCLGGLLVLILLAFSGPAETPPERGALDREPKESGQ